MLIYSVQAPEDAVVRPSPPAPVSPAPAAPAPAPITTVEPARTAVTALSLDGINGTSPTPMSRINVNFADDGAPAPTATNGEVGREGEQATTPSPAVPAPTPAPTTTRTPAPTPARTPATTTTPARPLQPALWRVAWSIVRNDSQTRTCTLTFFYAFFVIVYPLFAGD